MRPARGVRAGDQAELLQVGHHVADRRRRQLEPARRATACASRPAGRRRCSARPAFSAAVLARSSSIGSAPLQGRFCLRRRGSLWCNPANGDPLPARRARRQVPAPTGDRANVLEDIAALPRSPGPRGVARAQTPPPTPASPATRRSTPASSAPHATSRWCVGGDGTMLGIAPPARAPRHAAVGINQGRLGFITDIPLGQLRPSARRRCSPATTRRSSAPMLEGGVDARRPVDLRRAGDERRGRQPRRDRRHGRAADRRSTASSSPTSAPTA